MTRPKFFLGSSDPGGANVIAAIVRRLDPHVDVRLFTDPGGYRVESLKDRYELMGESIETLFDAGRPDRVVVGTSLFSSVERCLIAESQKRNIPCAAVIDHWTCMRRRFQDENGTERFPDMIYVPDEKAKELALDEGLPSKQIRIFGQPHFHDAHDYKPLMSREAFWRDRGMNPDRRILVFVSDALTETAEGDGSTAVAEFGYTEFDILEHVLSHVVSEKDLSVVIKLHPREKPGKFSRALSAYPDVVVIQKAPLWEMLSHADYVIGMFSSALVEASALGRRPLRVEIGARENLLPVPDSFFFDRVVDAAQLPSALDRYLTATSPSPTALFPDRFSQEINSWMPRT